MLLGFRHLLVLACVSKNVKQLPHQLICAWDVARECRVWWSELMCLLSWPFCLSLISVWSAHLASPVFNWTEVYYNLAVKRLNSSTHFGWTTSLPCSRLHMSYDDCPEDKREDYQNCSLLYCVQQLCTVTHTHTHTHTHTYGSFLQLTNGLGLHLANGCGYIATICLVVSISMGLVASVDKPSPTNQQPIAFSALTWLVRHQEEHLACKNDWWGDGGFLPSHIW